MSQLFYYLLLFGFIIKINGRIPEEQSIPNSITPATTTIAPQIEPQKEPCFYAERELCYQNKTTSCECNAHPIYPDKLVCCNVTDIEKSFSCVVGRDWLHIHIINATLDELDVSLKFWKRLDSLIVTDGSINRITKEFTKFSLPKCVNISNNNLMDINQRAFKDLTHLQFLDISHNNLSNMPNVNQNNLTLDIR